MRLDEIAQQPAFDKRSILAELVKLKIKSKSKINADGSVDVNGKVEIPRLYTEIPVQFRNVSGMFDCSFTNIVSLKGAPRQVGGDFWCNDTQITSLQYAPQSVGGDFWCQDTLITSLQCVPQSVGGSFYCNTTNITSLHNIHKTHSNWVIGKRLVLPDNCTHLLGLAYIPGIKQVQLGRQGKPIDVIHNVFEWQEKLLEMGPVEQAQL